jgi:methionyl-tRNA formyltransferase
MTQSNLRIVFFGTPDFAAYSLEKIVKSGFQVVGVVTAIDKPAGRGQKITESAVKRKANELGLKLLQPSNLKSDDFMGELQSLNPNIGVVIAFRMLPEKVWSFPALGTINLHGSLLPQYRGAAPIHHAIINGETVTGLTTFFLKHEIDTGDIIAKKELAIGENETLGELHDRMMVDGGDLMIKTLELISTDKYQTTPQDFSSELKLAPKLNRQFAELSLDLSLHDFHNKVRGLSPFPGAWIQSQWGDLKIFNGEKSDFKSSGLKKGFHIESRNLLVVLHDGCYKINELQLPGKPKISANDFINGLK